MDPADIEVEIEGIIATSSEEERLVAFKVMEHLARHDTHNLEARRFESCFNATTVTVGDNAGDDSRFGALVQELRLILAPLPSQDIRRTMRELRHYNPVSAPDVRSQQSQPDDNNRSLPLLQHQQSPVVHNRHERSDQPGRSFGHSQDGVHLRPQPQQSVIPDYQEPHIQPQTMVHDRRELENTRKERDELRMQVTMLRKQLDDATKERNDYRPQAFTQLRLQQQQPTGDSHWEPLHHQMDHQQHHPFPPPVSMSHLPRFGIPPVNLSGGAHSIPTSSSIGVGIPSQQPSRFGLASWMPYLLAEQEPDQLLPFHTAFESIEEVQWLEAEYKKLNDKPVSPQMCADFPSDIACLKHQVNRVIQAILARPHPGNDMVAKRGVPGEFEDNYKAKRVGAWKKAEVDMTAWKILFAVRLRKLGLLEVGSWSGEDWYYKSFPTFMLRLEAVLHGIRESKSALYDINSTPFLNRITSHPEKEVRLKIINGENNRGKRKADLEMAAYMRRTKAGRVEDGKVIVNGEEISLIARPEGTTEQPNKRRKTREATGHDLPVSPPPPQQRQGQRQDQVTSAQQHTTMIESPYARTPAGVGQHQLSNNAIAGPAQWFSGHGLQPACRRTQEAIALQDQADNQRASETQLAEAQTGHSRYPSPSHSHHLLSRQQEEVQRAAFPSTQLGHSPIPTPLLSHHPRDDRRVRAQVEARHHGNPRQHVDTLIEPFATQIAEDGAITAQPDENQVPEQSTTESPLSGTSDDDTPRPPQEQIYGQLQVPSTTSQHQSQAQHVVSPLQHVEQDAPAEQLGDLDIRKVMDTSLTLDPDYPLNDELLRELGLIE